MSERPQYPFKVITNPVKLIKLQHELNTIRNGMVNDPEEELEPEKLYPKLDEVDDELRTFGIPGMVRKIVCDEMLRRLIAGKDVPYAFNLERAMVAGIEDGEIVLEDYIPPKEDEFDRVLREAEEKAGDDNE